VAVQAVLELVVAVRVVAREADSNVEKPTTTDEVVDGGARVAGGAAGPAADVLLITFSVKKHE
jgi:hypothetical protein